MTWLVRLWPHPKYRRVLSALMTEDYLEVRAARGSRERFEAVLRKVPDLEPGLWLRMQAEHDLWHAERKLHDEVEQIPRHAMPGMRVTSPCRHPSP